MDLRIGDPREKNLRKEHIREHLKINFFFEVPSVLEYFCNMINKTQGVKNGENMLIFDLIHEFYHFWL